MSKELNIKLSKLRSEMLSKARIKECFHFNKEECDGGVIAAHSVQANGRLSLLEEEVNKNMRLYSFIEKQIDDFGYTSLKPIGKSQASIFFGFCGYHDKTLFTDIEDKPFEENSKTIFLHSYRAFAQTHHTKKEQLRYFIDEKEKFTNEEVEGTEAGVNDGLLVKIQLDRILKDQSYSDLEYFLYELPKLLPIACSSSYSPTFTPMSNKPINMHIDPDVPYQDIFVSVVPDKLGTKVIISCLREHEKCKEYLDELNEMGDEELEKTLSAIIILGVENTFISPWIYTKLSKSEKEALIRELNYSNIFNPILHFPTSHPKSELNLFDSKFYKS